MLDRSPKDMKMLEMQVMLMNAGMMIKIDCPIDQQVVRTVDGRTNH